MRLGVGSFELDVDLKVEAGEVVAVLGPNGAGKTSILRGLAGLLPLDVGRVALDGVVLEEPAASVYVPSERRPIGMVFQDYLLFPHLTVVDNIAFGLRSRGTPRAAATATARQWLERVGLAAEAERRPGSLSGGEHQLAQILGMFGMISLPNALFLLDEPESHFNPQWRVRFMTRVLDMPTPDGTRRDVSSASQQDCLLTTHAPFVPSDMPRDRVFIFGKDTETGVVTVRNPDIETYGTTFDAIIEECFGVRPPISEEPRQDIQKLMESNDPEEIRTGMMRLGYSVEKAFLADRLRQLTRKEEA